MSQSTRKALAGALGDCVHVAGVTRFLTVAEDEGYETVFTGPATDLESFVDAVSAHKPDIIGVSYRLTPDNARTIFRELRDMLAAAGVLGRARIFAGGTPPVAAVAREFDYFDAVFSGEESPHEVARIIRGDLPEHPTAADFPQRTI